MSKKTEKQDTIELSAVDIEAIQSTLPPPSLPKRPSIFRDAEGRNIIDDPFARTIIDGRYEVMRCLGTGAMGSVFLVNHLRLNKLFALKMVNPDLAGIPEFVARFEREANACSRLEHPNCISVTDFGHTNDGSLYLVMEYADGNPLSDLVDEGEVPIEDAIEYTRQILMGLKHAHAGGLVHRDIKLENVVKCRRDDGQTILKILDFGMAKNPYKDAKNINITLDGVVMGTPQYMAPEQIRDDNVDGRADLYAVGVTFFRLLARRQVFAGESHMDVFTTKLTYPAPTLSELTGKTYPEEVEAFVAKAVKREADERFQTADEMLEALNEVEKRIGGAEEGRASTGSGVVSRTVGGIGGIWGRIKEETVAWYECREQFGASNWRMRGIGLFTTRLGRVLLIRVLAAVLLFSALFSAFSSTEAPPDHESPVAASTVPSPIPDVEKAPVEIPKAVEKPVAGKAAAVVEPAATPQKSATEAPKSGVSASSVEADPALIEAALLIEQRKCQKADKKLADISPVSPRVTYLKGRAKMCRGQRAQALVFYREAVKQDAMYRADARILEDLKSMLSFGKTRDDALAFMAEDIGKPALPVLIQLAGHHNNKTVRHEALAVVERHGAVGQVDMAVALELDLNQTPSCKERREIVKKLAALNTKQARGVLVRARDAEVKEGFFRTRPKHGCVKPDIIRALADMKKKK